MIIKDVMIKLEARTHIIVLVIVKLVSLSLLELKIKLEKHYIQLKMAVQQSFWSKWRVIWSRILANFLSLIIFIDLNARSN